jgi:O-antigen/teichoic acid export membrane protein
VTPAPEPEGFRQRVLRGGRYIILRQGLGLAIGAGGVLLLTRLIGPAEYGLYAGALAIVTFVADVARLGVEVHLVRREQEPDRSVYSQAFTLLLLGGVVVAGLSVLVQPLLRLWFQDERFIAPLQALLLAVPLVLISHPAFAALERELDFRKVAFLELVGQLIFYTAAIALALIAESAWAPVVGFWLWQTWLVVGSFWAARLRPKLVWSPVLVREMLRYGVSYSAANWIWSARLLVNPLIVGRYLGPESVAYVSLATRLVEVASFVRTATWRLSIAALAKVQGDVDRIRRAIDEGTMLQILGVAPFLCAGSIGTLLLPDLLGGSWYPVIGIFPFLALGALANAAFSMHSSALYVLKRNRQVALFHVTSVGLLAGGAVILVPMIGLIGYGLAEVAAMAAYFVIHRQVANLLPIRYHTSAPWFFVLSPPIFVPLVPLPYAPLLFIPAVVLLSLPRYRRPLAYYVGQLRPQATEG